MQKQTSGLPWRGSCSGSALWRQSSLLWAPGIREEVCSVLLRLQRVGLIRLPSSQLAVSEKRLSKCFWDLKLVTGTLEWSRSMYLKSIRRMIHLSHYCSPSHWFTVVSVDYVEFLVLPVLPADGIFSVFLLLGLVLAGNHNFINLLNF